MTKKKKTEKLVIAISSSALFDLSESDKIFRTKGEIEYQKFQKKNINKILKPGIAFPFISKLLSLNEIFKSEAPEGVVDVVLLSKNSNETGLRVFKSIEHYELGIEKAGFFSGESPYKYIKAFKASLFLSANYHDVEMAIRAGYPAGMVMKDSSNKDLMNEDYKELRIAFDFDGVLADRESEDYFQKEGLEKYRKNEVLKSALPLKPGLLKDFATRIGELRKLESARYKIDKTYKRIIRISLITARGAPAHERAIRTLNSWGIDIDSSFFLAGLSKKDILETMRPNIFFDDQEKNLQGVKKVPSVFIPFVEKLKI